ncbi:MAG: 4-alpha-glucanotransferase [Ignavibacteriales bacterium CG_4_9_14_3_um_filter_34_10]|nr:MAG: 4-alpha-glucanotransferase [Ignavibacteriales bacterium CG_4_9_14_3_um_filter_34_10]
MTFQRSAGILLHPTSLPGKFSIGDLGNDAYYFIDFLANSGQTLWQIFPLGPTGYGDSPYQCFSAFAGNPLLISPDLLVKDGLLSEDDAKTLTDFNKHKVDFGKVIDSKNLVLRKAFEKFRPKIKQNKEFKNFCDKNIDWLNDYSLFMASKNHHKGIIWTDWEESIAFRKDGAIEKWTEKLKDEVNYQKFLQFTFNAQWQNLKKYAHEKEIKIIGDMPIFIAYDSADTWADKNLFTVNEKGKLETVAGVPPDYFSPTGQLWGNPLYRWNEMEKDDFKWWRKRVSKLLELVDIVRIDHFRGFDAFWEIPGDALTAQTGKWVKAPGHKLFKSIKKHLGDVPIIAEDLGVITREVEELRDSFNFPGIKIMQFAFGDSGEKKFLPHNFIPNCVVHTGSHDNDTTNGFFDKEKILKSGIFEAAQEYLGYFNNDICQQLIKTAYSSVANTVVIPMQDILDLDSSARMNFPGKLGGGNWSWRFSWDQVDPNIPARLKRMCAIYERPKKTLKNVEIEIINE